MAKTVTFIAPTANSNEPIPLADIPQAVKQLAEKIYDHVRKTGARVRLEWDSTDERDLELRQLASYGAQRSQGKLAFRVSPTRKLPDTTKDVRFTADIPANGAANGSGQEKTAGVTAR